MHIIPGVLQARLHGCENLSTYLHPEQQQKMPYVTSTLTVSQRRRRFFPNAHAAQAFDFVATRYSFRTSRSIASHYTQMSHRFSNRQPPRTD